MSNQWCLAARPLFAQQRLQDLPIMHQPPRNDD